MMLPSEIEAERQRCERLKVSAERKLDEARVLSQRASRELGEANMLRAESGKLQAEVVAERVSIREREGVLSGLISDAERDRLAARGLLEKHQGMVDRIERLIREFTSGN